MCPIFEYECPNCQLVEEKLVLPSERPMRPLCPKCGQAKMEKIMSVSNFSLKGKGWSKDSYGLRNRKDKKNG